MKQVRIFLKDRFVVADWQLKFFFLVLFGTTLLSYINAIFVFLPDTVLGFNWSGIAWITALFLSISILPSTKKSSFPMVYWAPWVIYILTYVALDFSTNGLQLTLQYLLPILMGYISGTFEYSRISLSWILQRLSKITAIIFFIGLFYTLVFGYSFQISCTPMFLLIFACISLSFYFFTLKKIFLIIYSILFLIPFLNVTRMAILSFGLTYILHFANKRLSSKVTAAFLGGLLLLGVSNSKGFQEKTFYEGSGDINEISVNYYDSDNFNSSGRKSWKDALEPGLNAAPILGNGPRTDAAILGSVIGKEVGEAHNDYMSVRFNYGFVGLVLLFFGFIGSFLKMLEISKIKKNKIFQLLVLSNLTLFIGFLLLMYSDNILKYTIWFPNYFFVLIGICFSIYSKGFENEKEFK